MSKLWKGVKKVFKKVTKFVKKYWKYIVIAVAIYFTAGIALAAMPSTAAFSAAMPGFGVGGMFSNAAVAMGATGAAGSGIAGTVAANAAAVAGSTAAAGGGVLAGGSGAGAAATGTGGFVMPGATASMGTTAGNAAAAAAGTTGTVASTAAPVVASTTATSAAAATAKAAAAAKAAGIGSKTVAAVKGMSGLEKVALAGTVFKGVGGLLSDSEDKVNKRQHARMYGQSYGIGRDGTGPGMSGMVSDAWGGRFGGDQESGTGGEGSSPFSTTPVPQTEGSDPFTDMNYSEQEASRDAGYVNQGYRNKDYRPG